MKIGLCAGPERAAEAVAMGFDYLELNASALAAMDDAAYNKVGEQLEKAGIPCLGTNCFYPGGIQLTEDDPEQLRDYVARVFRRVAGLGGKFTVFGSGGARRIPENITMAEGREKLYRVAVMMAEEAERYGIRIALEPLNFRETNVILTEEEGAELVRRVNNPSFRLLLDVFHYSFELLPMEEIARYQDLLIHFHIASPWKRMEPLPRDGYEDDYQRFFSVLREMGYNGGVSLEGGSGEADSLRKSCQYLHQLAQG